MEQYDSFEAFWNVYSDKTVEDRNRYFQSISKYNKNRLILSFFKDGWSSLIAHNIIDERIDFVKSHFGIDLLDLRIKAIKFHQVFIIEKPLWEYIESFLSEFDDFYDSNLIFGGLVVQESSNHKNCVIKSRRS